VVEAIERLYPDRLDEHLERLAHHAVRGEVWEKAVAYCRQAGAKAIARTAHREAAAWLEQALAALRHLPTERETMEQGIDLRLDLRTALIPLAEHGRLLECLREAEAMAEALGDRGRLGYTLSLLPHLLFLYGEPDQAVETGRYALAVVEALGDLRLQIATNFSVGLLYMEQGDYRAAIACHRWIVGTLEGDLLRERPGMAAYPAVSCRGDLAWCLAELGEFAEGTALGEEAVRLAEALNHPYSLAGACNFLGGLHLRRGQPDQAIAALERGVGLCQTWEFPQLFPQVASRLGAAYTLAGRPFDGLAILEQATEHAASRGLMSNASLQAAWLSDAYLAAGRIDDAIEVAGRALDLAATRHERGPQAWVLRLAGEIAARREPGDEEGAETYHRAALALAEELGMRPLQAHCHLGLGKLYRRIGRLDEARAELATAVAMLREMGMAFWLPEAERELAEAGR
jgi:tetratricopeptide (TPR) repeat protein